MEAIERITINNDWLTIQFIVIGFLILVVNYLEKNRLQQLFALPFNSLYFTNFENSTDYLYKGFSILLFVISHLTFSIFLYLLIYRFDSKSLNAATLPYLSIVGIGLGYWLFRFTIGRFLSWIFDLKDFNSNAVYIKSSYYFSINLYLLILVVFGVYSFDWEGNYIIVVLILYSILLAIRYFKFIFSAYNFSIANLFYFILYLCALEIAPFLLLYKWSVGKT